jgi:hypothetical protein
VLSRINRWLALSLRAEAARCLGDRTFTDEHFSLYQEWSDTWAPFRRRERPPGRTAAELWKEHGDVLRVFWLLDAARVLPFFGDHFSGPFSMLTGYERKRVYPVVLPMWERIDWEHRRRLDLVELCWRGWGPFAHDPYSAKLLGEGTQCAVLDATGITLYRPETILDERQVHFLWDLTAALRNVIARRENLATEPGFFGAPDWVMSSTEAKPFYTQLHRAAAQVWAFHIAHRRCPCGSRLARSTGGNPSATCAKPECRRAYERSRKHIRRILAHLTAHHGRGFPIRP